MYCTQAIPLCLACHDSRAPHLLVSADAVLRASADAKTPKFEFESLAQARLPGTVQLNPPLNEEIFGRNLAQQKEIIVKVYKFVI